LKKYGLIFIVVFGLMTASVAAYTRITSSSGHSPRWAAMPIPFWINQRGYPSIANGSDTAAVLASFRTWQAIPSADIRFDYRGPTSASTVGHDGVNMVSFVDTSTPLGSSVIAVTFSWFNTQGNEVLFDEADIIFSTAMTFSTSGESGKFDIQSVLTHEIGHLLGLDHAGMVSSVMVPFGQTSQINQRTLQYDDIAGVSEIYPKGNPAVGRITGFVLNGGSGLFGAHVVAVDSSGTAWVSTLSQPTGYFDLKFLPPGSYKIYAEALDGPVTEQNISTSWYRNLSTDFGTTYYRDVSTFGQAQPVQVTSGLITGPLNIQVLPKSTTGLRLTRPAFAPRVAVGTSGTLTIGGRDITSGTQFSPSSANITLGPPTYGGAISSVAPTSASMNLSVAGTASTGPKNISVMRGVDTSIASGAIVVVNPQPTIQQISPLTGPGDGGTVVTISGSNFRDGAKVYFDGLTASDVTVMDSTTITATAPQDAPGTVNVVVVNPDGTNGLMSHGFTYLPPAPSISAVDPASGPPSTVVTITGAQFDTHPQNIEVRFNGTIARVVSATPTSFTAIVPYGSASGPITVSVFGVPATGSANFTVTAAADSSNHALNTYNFIDSSPAKGGTALTFQGPNPLDDGLASVQLPFTFSLFQDIYLAGSPITVSTNGWISLEIVTDPYTYQNGPLPGKSAVDAGGTSRVIPPSLIAPFYQDLALVPNVSSVSTKVIGTAPNRQFIVQFSKLTVIDENGNDLNANLTFETILFEGSNDIQFIYQSVSGPRSDGSSATIGIQNLARDTAVQTGFRQSKIFNGYFVSYRFDQGSYVATEQPAKPVLNVSPVQSSISQLFAAWTSTDAPSIIREYQYAIGKTPGGADVLPFTSTIQNSAVVTGLSLTAGSTYYFTVRAVNNAGMAGDTGVSAGIRVDPSFVPDVKIIPAAPQTSDQFSGIALFAPSAMSVVLKAFDTAGNLIMGSGIENPVTISLSAGRQYARLVRELFGFGTFDGWIQVEASAAGLGAYTATGTTNMSEMDGSVPSRTSADFVLFHPGGLAFLVNPSPTLTANVTINEFGTGNSRTLTIPPMARISTPVSAVSRVQSTEPLVAIEDFGTSPQFGIGMPFPVSGVQSSFVIPDAVTGAGYTTVLALANIGSLAVDAQVSFGGISKSVHLNANAATRVSLSDLLQFPSSDLRTGAVRVDVSGIFGGHASLLGVADIQNAWSATPIGVRPASTDIWFPHVANGNGMYTGLAIATGSTATTVSIDVYLPNGGAPQSATINLGPNQQIAKQISELVPGVATQIGGYIHIRADQPVWTWEIYGSATIMASGPPL